MSEVEALRDERNHWIGEAKKFERLYRSADERATRWFLERNEARETIGRVESLTVAPKDFDEIGEGWVSVSAIRAALTEGGTR